MQIIKTEMGTLSMTEATAQEIAKAGFDLCNKQKANAVALKHGDRWYRVEIQLTTKPGFFSIIVRRHFNPLQQNSFVAIIRAKLD